MKALYDNHNHSQFSFDGKRTSIEKSASFAAESGLAGICFTDHYDFYVPPMKAAHENLVPETFDIKEQQSEINRVNEKISLKKNDFQILKGIEIGLCFSKREDIRNLLSCNSFDTVIASLHYLDETDPFWGDYYNGKSWKEAYGRYLEILYNEIIWLGDDFDIMGHFDYVARYAPYPQASILYKDFPDIMEAILCLLAENGNALEINTKTYQSYNGRVPVLDSDILKRYRELGGEVISLGSDSHDAERVGFHFDMFATKLLEAGFKYIAHYKNRRLVMTPIN